MSTIWMDPVELTAAAATLGQQATSVQEAVLGLETACTCPVPAPLAAWFSQELVAIAEDGLRVAIAYVYDAIDSRTRALQIESDQSLTATEPSLTEAVVSGSAIIGGNVTASTLSMGAAFTGPSIIGGNVSASSFPMGAAFSGPGIIGGTFLGSSPSAGAQNLGALSSATFAANNPLWGAPLSGLPGSTYDPADHIRTMLAPNGLSFSDGSYVDSGGDRETSLSGAYRDPETGKYDL